MSKNKANVQDEKKEYKYTQEISQMMFVFGEVQDPNPNAVNLVEDIVRGQILEIVIQARQLSAKRGARHITPEDLIFIIRDDRAKVNRLRTYMSWKDVRKNAKEPGGDGKADVDDALDEGADADANTSKPKKRIVKLSWEITTIYSEILKTISANNPGRHSGHSDDEDEDEMEAHEDSVKRLRDADEATRHMTKEEYMHYSECRQASFTYRKAKRFKEYLNLPSQLELRSDDTIDILGFLAFEIVRALTLSALQVKRSLEEAAFANRLPSANTNATSTTTTTATTTASAIPTANPSLSASPDASKKRKISASQQATSSGSPSLHATKRLRGSVITSFSQQKIDDRDKDNDEDDGMGAWGGQQMPASALFLPPPEARTPLTPQNIQDAFSRMQRDHSHLKGAGMRNWRGGLVRTRISLI